MREINGFECEKCNTFYIDKESALKCESEHTALEDVTLVGLSYDTLKGQYGLNYGYTQKVPKCISVRICGTIARYKLEQFGPKGV